MQRKLMALLLTVLVAAPFIPVTAYELNQSPAAPGEWGFHPIEDAAAPVNPPSFTWRPEKWAVSYRLEVTGKAGEKVLDTPSVWSSFAPEAALPEGEYAWRYAAVDKDGKAVWSKTRAFSLTSGAKPIAARPNLAELKRRIPESHPRLLMRPEDVPHLKELAAGPLAEPWARMRASADKILARMPDTTEPPKYPESVQRGDGEWKEIWWGNRVRGIEVMGSASTLAFVYQLTGDERYGQGARELLMAFTEWDPKGATNWRYNDEAAMPLVYHPSRTYSWIHDLLTGPEREKVRQIMRVRGEDCYDSLKGHEHLWNPYGSHSNRAWHWLGEAAIAFQGEIPEAEKWLDYSTLIFHTCYPVWGDEDGGWHEGTSYWSSYQGRFLYWTEASRAAFGINPFEMPFYSACGYFGLYALPPGSNTGAFGDLAQGSRSSSVAQLMASFAAGAGNPYWQWYADEHGVETGSGYLDFLLAARSHSIEAKAPSELPASRVFHGTGLAILNTNLLDGKDNVQIHFKSSPFGRYSHGYNANNAFLLNIDGQRALIKSGARDMYGSPHHREWMWETKSDNAILVDGQGQRPHTSNAVGEITAFDTTPGVDIVEGEAGQAYDNLERWTRRIIFFKPGVILIHDILEAPKPSEYQWLLHAEGAFELGSQEASWKGRPGTVNIAFLTPGKLNITQSGKFDVPPASWSNKKLDEWHLTAATSAPAARQEFITLLRVNGAKAEGTLEKEGVVRLQLPEGSATISLGDHEFRVKTGEYDHTF